MMDNWGDILAQVPGMAVLAGIVALFLRAMSTAGQKFQENLEQQSKVLTHVTDKFAESTEKTSESLDKNTEILGQVSSRLDDLNEIERLRLFDQKLKERSQEDKNG